MTHDGMHGCDYTVSQPRGPRRTVDLAPVSTPYGIMCAALHESKHAQNDGYRVPARSADVGQSGVPLRERSALQSRALTREGQQSPQRDRQPGRSW